MKGPFIATAEVGGPFKVKSKPYVLGSAALTETQGWPNYLRYSIIALIIFVLAAAAVLTVRSKKRP